MRSKKRVCYVVCYKDPDYIRTITLTQALSRIEGIELVIVKNKLRGILRYIEVPPKLLWVRLAKRPDTFIVGFRAHEIFWALFPAMAGKKIIFDEFINLHDYLASEHHKLKPGSRSLRAVDAYVKWIYKKSRYVLTDTEAASRLSAEIYGTPAGKLAAVPVGADEQTFYPRPAPAGKKRFEVFFFGNMLPLHGLDVMLEAIKMAAPAGIHFILAGGRGQPAMLYKITSFIKLNKLSNSVTHLPWVPYAELPSYIAAADMCLGGPFGLTGQAGRVITGKTYQFLAMARPTVIGRNDASQLFKDRADCLLVERGSSAALAGAVTWGAAHPKELAAIGARGRQLFEKEFSGEVIHTKLGILLND